MGKRRRARVRRQGSWESVLKTEWRTLGAKSRDYRDIRRSIDATICTGGLPDTKGVRSRGIIQSVCTSIRTGGLPNIHSEQDADQVSKSTGSSIYTGVS